MSDAGIVIDLVALRDCKACEPFTKEQRAHIDSMIRRYDSDDPAERSEQTWHIAHLPFYEITMMTLLLKDGWEPFAADREYVYLRLHGEPPNWPGQHHLLEILPPRYA